ncbi:MAG: hypothetical protein ACT6U0_17275 [Shinella sp.]|uniref:hypothetical protein n=1 Tax=Shinella sp. TaxID=1870904 RepID=UPI004035B329
MAASCGGEPETRMLPDCSGNKKGRGETAPTFLIITFSPVPVHPWSRASGDGSNCERQIFSSAHSNADAGYIGGHCVQNKRFQVSPVLNPHHGSSITR